MSDSHTTTKGLHYKAGPHCVLMLHGLGANSIELTRLAKEIHAQNFTVVAPDIQGYCFGTEISAWQDWVKQIQTFLWELQHSHTTVSIVGLSMGATLALALAQREQVTSIACLSTALAYDGWSMPWYQFLSRYAAWIPFSSRYSFRETEPYGVKNEEMRAMIKRAMKKNHLSESGVDVLPVKYLQEGQRLIKDVRSKIAEVACPALFIHAVDDETVHISNAEWAWKNISATDKDIVYLGDSYHMITVDNERETVGQETIRFLKKSINNSQGHSEFEVPPIQSAELRRYLRNTA